MTQRVPNGLVLSIASTFGTAFNITGVSNANPAVATMAVGHAVAVQDIIEVVSSGWDGLERRVARVSALATNDATLEGIDTSSTQQYPAGSGGGSGREITAWTAIAQVISVDRNGGEQQYADASLLSDLVLGRQVPTVRSPINMAVTIAEDPAMAWLSAVRGVAASRAPTPFRISYPGSGFLYGSAIWSLLEVPTMTANQIMQVTLDLALQSLPTRYAT